MIASVTKGDLFTFNSDVYIKVLRVAKDGTWADIKCSTDPDLDASPGWTKRQRLPFPAGFESWTPGGDTR